MPHIKNTSTSHNAEIYYEDYGTGKPVVLIHGRPLSGKSWEQQVWKLVKEGYRAITYDRRGFGSSSRPRDGYDYSTLAADLHTLITELDLQDVTLVGFSMGGGEIARYCTDYGTSKVSKTVLISSILPIVAHQDDNPNGVPHDDIEDIKKALWDDRVGYLKEKFTKNFYNHGLLTKNVSDAQRHYDWSIAAHASPRATIQTALSRAGTDFRPEMRNIDVPTMIIHGKADNVVPIETAGDQAAEMISNNEYYRIDDAPHGLIVTHADQVNELLINFLNK